MKKWKKTCYKRGNAGKNIKIAAFDVETRGLGGEILCATYMIEGQKPDVIIGSDCIDRLADVMFTACDHMWFAHNASYDWRYFLDIFKDNPSAVDFTLRNDNSIYQIKYSRKHLKMGTLSGDDFERPQTIIMRDSYAIWPHKLDDLAKNFCPDLPKLEIDIANFNVRNRVHIEYAKRDVEILVVGLRRLNDALYQNYGVNMAGTAASTAMRAWEAMIPENVAYFNPEQHELFIRSAYFGGLVFLTNTKKHQNTETYDINSSYPHQMRQHGVPYGRITETKSVRYGLPGVYEVTVRTPDNIRVPILPAREARGKYQAVLWPSGTFRTVVTSIELEFATKHGYRIFEVHRGITWEGLIYPFEEFVSRSETIRQKYKGQVFEVVAKLVQNSLYGKFASRRERKRIITEAVAGDGSIPMEAFGDFFIKTENAEDMMCLPQWSVWITANARLQLLRTVYEEIGVQNVIYGDTDSITVLCGSSPNSVGKKYGQFKLEKTWETFRAIAPKVYAGLSDGQWRGACKGIPAKRSGDDIFRDIYLYGITSVEIDYLPSFMVEIRKGERGLKHVKRSSTDIQNSKNWYLEGEDILPRAVGDAA